MNNIKINNHEVGDNYPTFITFEIGPTHNGIESAKRLIKHSADSGANAVKFQIGDFDRLVADKKQLFSYEILINRKTGEKKTVEEPLYDILKRRILPIEEWVEIKSYCDELGIAFFATVFFEEDIELLELLKCDSIKIASGDSNHSPLIRRAAQSGMSVQLDTGMASIEEVKKNVKIIEQEGNNKIIIHQCPSGYPAYLESINLNIIPILKNEFDYPIAFSDHSPGFDMNIAAVALGANLIEKTITEDRTTPSVEHMMSIEPDQLKNFIQSIRDMEIALGNGVRKISKDELYKRDSIRRSVFLNEDVKSGTKLNKVQVEFRRPGFNISPDKYEELIKKNATIKSNLKKGQPLKISDIL